LVDEYQYSGCQNPAHKYSRWQAFSAVSWLVSGTSWLVSGDQLKDVWRSAIISAIIFDNLGENYSFIHYVYDQKRKEPPEIGHTSTSFWCCWDGNVYSSGSNNCVQFVNIAFYVRVCILASYLQEMRII
jgi:hypothetical protein